MKVLMSGGGTAGHVYPALSVAATFVAEHDEVTFVGTPHGLEARLVPEAGVSFWPLSARGFDRSRPWTLLSAALIACASAVRAGILLGRLRPDVVLGFGGYVSIPVGLAAIARGIPLVLHEQNSVLGLANRLLSRWASAIGVTYEESASGLRQPERVAVTGNPVRPEVLASTRSVGREMLGISEDALVLLVFGGSRGARHLNEGIVALSDRLSAVPRLRVVHVAGPNEAADVRAALAGRGVGNEDDTWWKVYEYLADMGDAIAAADLVVSRAGATTLAELTVLGAASIVVPYPYATDDHQTKNAATLVDHGASVLVRDDDLDSPALADAVLGLLEDSGRRATMSAASKALGRPEAAHLVARLARQAASHGAPQAAGSDEGTP